MNALGEISASLGFTCFVKISKISLLTHHTVLTAYSDASWAAIAFGDRCKEFAAFAESNKSSSFATAVATSFAASSQNIFRVTLLSGLKFPACAQALQ